MPGIVPPTIAPIEPQPLIKPAAVAAPSRVPKSIAAVPLTSESGGNNSRPSRNRQPPSIQGVWGTLSRRNNISPEPNRQTTQIGLRREPNSLSEKMPASKTLAGPASSNKALSEPDLAMPAWSCSLRYLGDQKRIA